LSGTAAAACCPSRAPRGTDRALFQGERGGMACAGKRPTAPPLPPAACRQQPMHPWYSVCPLAISYLLY
jgi:hypothetical protein